MINGAQSKEATYTFTEMLERIANVEDEAELKLYERLIYEEKRNYALFYLELLLGAVRLKRTYLDKDYH